MNAPNSTDDVAQRVKIKLANRLRSLAWGDGKASFAALALNMGVYTRKESYQTAGNVTGLSAIANVLIKVK